MTDGCGVRVSSIPVKKQEPVLKNTHPNTFRNAPESVLGVLAICPHCKLYPRFPSLTLSPLPFLILSWMLMLPQDISSYKRLIQMLAQALALASMNRLWSKIRNVNFTCSPYTCYVKTTVQACCGLWLLQSMQRTLYREEKRVTWGHGHSCEFGRLWVQLPVCPAFFFLLYSPQESLSPPATFSTLLSFHAHMHDFKFLYNNLEVTMREHSGYLSFWDWFNSLNRSISTCICFPTKNTN